MGFFDFNHAIMRAPARSVVSGLRAVDRGAPSFDGVVREHEAYRRALEARGVLVEVLGALDAYPDSVFVEDNALVFQGAAIVLRLGAATRSGEARAIAPVLAERFERVLHLEEGTVDGGDVLATPSGVFIGQSARTDATGARALCALLADIGQEGRAVATPAGVLHFKSDCALLDEGTVLATARLAASGVFAGFNTLLTPDGEEAAANAVRVADCVFLSEGYPKTAELLDGAGFKVIPLATGEIGKIDAGLSCMSLRWRA